MQKFNGAHIEKVNVFEHLESESNMNVVVCGDNGAPTLQLLRFAEHFSKGFFTVTLLLQ